MILSSGVGSGRRRRCRRRPRPSKDRRRVPFRRQRPAAGVMLSGGELVVVGAPRSSRGGQMLRMNLRDMKTSWRPEARARSSWDGRLPSWAPASDAPRSPPVRSWARRASWSGSGRCGGRAGPPRLADLGGDLVVAEELAAGFPTVFLQLDAAPIVGDVSVAAAGHLANGLAGRGAVVVASVAVIVAVIAAVAVVAVVAAAVVAASGQVIARLLGSAVHALAPRRAVAGGERGTRLPCTAP